MKRPLLLSRTFGSEKAKRSEAIRFGEREREIVNSNKT